MKRVPSICCCLVLVLLFLPGILAIARMGRSEDYVRKVERRPMIEFPSNMGFQSAWFSQIDGAWADHIPFRGWIIDRRRRFDLQLGGRKFFGTATVGRDGWLFLRADAGMQLRGHAGVEDFRQRLNSIFCIANSRQTPLRVVIVPPKQVVYAEKMGWVESSASDRYAGERNRLREILAELSPEEVIPIEARYVAAKASATEPVYGPQDTHHSKTGCLILAKAIIDSFDASLWEPDAIRTSTGEGDPGDIVHLVGLNERRELRTVAWVQRPGVAVTREKPAEPASSYLEPVSFRAATHGGRKVLPGKTVIIQDSFIYSFLHLTLAQFFEHVTFLHYKALSPVELETYILNADRVVFEIAERECVPQFRRLVRDLPSAARVVVADDLTVPDVSTVKPGGVIERLTWESDKRMLEIRGWAPLDMRKPESRLFIRDPFGRIQLRTWSPLVPRERPDVAKHYPDDPALLYSGFSIRLSLNGEDMPHLATLEVFSLDANGDLCRLRRRDEGTPVSWQRRENAFTLALHYGTPAASDSRNIRGNLEAISAKGGNEIEIRGWAHADCSKPSTVLHLRLPENISPVSVKQIAWYRRPDLKNIVTAVSDAPPPSGFIITLELSGTLDDLITAGAISLEAKDGNGPPSRLRTTHVRVARLNQPTVTVDVGAIQRTSLPIKVAE